MSTHREVLKLKLDMKNKKNKLVLSITIGIVAVLLVTTMIIQFKSVDEYKKANIEDLREDELKTQIATYKSRYEEAQSQYQDNVNKINEYKTTSNEDKESSKLLDDELKQEKTLMGLTNVTGEGVVITLTDTNEAQYTSDRLRYLVNELRYAGAEAISINDNRIINLTDIVTINDSFIVLYGDVRISSPYTIKAIGDTTYLLSTLNMKNSGFVDLCKAEGLQIDVKKKKNITINKYTRDISTKYLKEEE